MAEIQKCKVEVTVLRNPETGRIRLMFDDGASYPIRDCLENIGIISAFEVELLYKLKILPNVQKLEPLKKDENI